MKKVCCSFCVLFLTIVSVAAQVDYVPYYRLVNRAKFVKCIHKDCDSAIAYYLQAFEMVDYILHEDLRDFTQCAVRLGKDSLVYYAMERCVNQTVPLSFIFSSDTFSDKYKNTEKWKECLAIEQENKGKYKAKHDIAVLYGKVLDSLLVSDQEVRKKPYWFYCKFPNSKKTKELFQNMHVTDSCNRLVLDEMIEKYDFPSEQNGYSNDYCLFSVVLIHYDDTIFFNNVETKAFREGKISPRYYAWRTHRIAGIFGWDITKYTYFYNKKRGEKMTPQEKEQVDKNRYEIGLPSVEEEKLIIQCKRLEKVQGK